MTRDELIELFQKMEGELNNRIHLGGYNADAGIIIFLTRAILMLAEHLIEKEPLPKPKKVKKHARNRKTKAKGK